MKSSAYLSGYGFYALIEVAEDNYKDLSFKIRRSVDVSQSFDETIESPEPQEELAPYYLRAALDILHLVFPLLHEGKINLQENDDYHFNLIMEHDIQSGMIRTAMIDREDRILGWFPKGRITPSTWFLNPYLHSILRKIKNLDLRLS